MEGRQAAAQGAPNPADPVVARLEASGPLPLALAAHIRRAAARLESLPPKAVLQVEGEAHARPRWLASGWACRHRHLPDGRRFIFDLVLPGDGVGVCLTPRPLAMTSLVALTPVEVIDARDFVRPEVLDAQPALSAALQSLADADERRLLRHAMRLGRMSALERTGDLLLELHERLSAVGLVQGDRFPLPLTQEGLSDVLGLSVVHVNRTLQELRRAELVTLNRGWAHFQNRHRLEDFVGTSHP